MAKVECGACSPMYANERRLFANAVICLSSLFAFLSQCHTVCLSHCLSVFLALPRGCELDGRLVNVVVKLCIVCLYLCLQAFPL